MLFDCTQVKILWDEISKILGINVTYKLVLFGFISETGYWIEGVNEILSIVAYHIYMSNNRAKRDQKGMNIKTVKPMVKRDLELLAKLGRNQAIIRLYKNVVCSWCV